MHREAGDTDVYHTKDETIIVKCNTRDKKSGQSVT